MRVLSVTEPLKKATSAAASLDVLFWLTVYRPWMPVSRRKLMKSVGRATPQLQGQTPFCSHSSQL
jgi:hypothetical protein